MDKPTFIEDGLNRKSDFGDLMKEFWLGMYEVLPGVLEQSHSLGCKYLTVKSTYKITSIKQSPVLKCFLVLS